MNTHNKKPAVYTLQNNAIHTARAQLEAKGVLDPWSNLDQVREMAGRLNLGINSISRLSLMQRRMLITQLIEMGAQVKNPELYASDLEAERRAGRTKEPRKIILWAEPSEEQLRMLNALAAKVNWRSPDGYIRFCYKLLRAPRPRNSKEVTRLRLALESLRKQRPLATRSADSL